MEETCNLGIPTSQKISGPKNRELRGFTVSIFLNIQIISLEILKITTGT